MELDERPVAQPKFRIHRCGISPHAGTNVAVHSAANCSARLYGFPTGVDGSGQCIAIIELGGGFRQQDLQQYFGTQAPTVTAVSVDKGHNKPTGNPDGPDGEVMLDIEVAGSIAPKAQIAVYFSPNTNKGFVDAINAAVHEARQPQALRGFHQLGWSRRWRRIPASSINAFHQAFQAAALMGVTIFAAAGDSGSSDGMSSGNHVDFPAADDLVTGCGGTSLISTNKTTIKSEVVWNDSDGATGGGMSKVFAVPSYQQGLHCAKADGTKTALTGRGVPDISADADPATGYNVLVDGQSFAIGGTSAVAPLMSGLIALLNQELGKPIGPLNPTLYSLRRKREPGVPRHHQREQRHLCRRRGLGRLHGSGCAERECIVGRASGQGR